MQSNFALSLKAVLASEGGNDDDPDDHGGRTSRGITQREYTAWLKESNRPDGDVWKAPQGDINTIYHEEYWEPWCDIMPVGIDYLYFDMAVNAGSGVATKLLQRSLGVAADGRIGAITRAAIKSADPLWLIDKYTSAKRVFYQSLHQPKYIRGWLNRCASVQHTANLMIQGKYT